MPGGVGTKPDRDEYGAAHPLTAMALDCLARAGQSAVDDVFLNDHDCDIIFAAANAAAITDRAESALAHAANPARLKSKVSLDTFIS